MAEYLLSDLKFAGVIPNPRPTPSPATNEPAAFAPAQTYPDQSSPGVNRSRPYERLAADKISEELAPDAAIWQLYVEEAKEHDDELVDGKNKNLDMMLLFAALFSAILTAFLIESKTLLQQDNSELTVALLLLVAQSQQRVEQSALQPTSTPIELPRFSAPLSARWINGLWFLALALSLSAALIAMLAKEWLAAYNTSRPRSPRTYALLRQSRLVGLTDWRALHIIDLLPSMLHLALLLFSLGLVLYLWTLDWGIAVVIAIITGATLAFYTGTIFLGAIHEFCPFVTQISMLVHSALNIYAEDWMLQRGRKSQEDKHSNSYTTDEDLRALVWLAAYARDPAVGDCSYQALAGFRFRDLGRDPRNAEGGQQSVAGLAPTEARTSDGVIETLPSHEGAGGPPNQYELVRDLFDALCTRFSNMLVYQPREIVACQGMNVARYANALPQLVEFLETYANHQLVGKEESESNVLPISEPSIQVAFKALDTIWSNECPPLSSDSYALLTSAELRLTLMACDRIGQRSSQHNISNTISPGSPPSLDAASDRRDEPTQGHVGVIVNSTEVPPIDSTTLLFDLRARYSRALNRAGILFRYHADGRAPVGANALIDLLYSVRDAAQRSNLNPEHGLSTNQPQSEGHVGGSFSAHATGLGLLRSSNLWVIDELNGLLIGLLRLLASAEVHTITGLESAASGTLSAIAPILLKQQLEMGAMHKTHEESEQKSFTELLETWPRTEVFDTTEVATQSVRQLIIFATFIVPHAQCNGVGRLLEWVMFALYERLKTDPDRQRAYDTFGEEDTLSLMDELVSVVDRHISRLDRRTLKPFINIFLLDHLDRSFLSCSFSLFGYNLPNLFVRTEPWKTSSTLLRTLAVVPVQVSELKMLLADLANQVKNPAFIPLFVSHEGFSALWRIGEHEEYYSIVAKCITRIIEIIELAAEFVVGRQAVPGLLDAVAFVMKALPPSNEDLGYLLSSLCKILPQSKHLDKDLAGIIVNHPTTEIILRTLREATELPDERAAFLAYLEDLEMIIWHADNLSPEGLTPSFEFKQYLWRSVCTKRKYFIHTLYFIHPLLGRLLDWIFNL